MSMPFFVSVSKKKKIVLVLLLVLVLVGLYHLYKPLPKDISFAGSKHTLHSDDLTILFDQTYRDAEGRRVSQQEIFDEIFAMLDDAGEYILLDLFLFNDFGGENAYRHLAQELTDKLIAKKKASPTVKIDFITDEINTMYGTRKSTQLRALEDAGINVIYTNLMPLRDSNVLYSAPWRIFGSWFGVGKSGIFPHPLSAKEQKVSLRSYLRMANFKANHRKIVLSDDGKGGLVSLITSANPHDGSAAHSNVAAKIRGNIGRDVYRAEEAVAQMSGRTLTSLPKHLMHTQQRKSTGKIIAQILTEQKIKDAVVATIDATTAGENIDLGMFYFSDRTIVKALKKASARGVKIRIILDPNKDAFGHKKNGIPNRQVANELVRASDGKIAIRWYKTHGEQFHTKILIVHKHTHQTILILGSANYTRRNIGDYNLEEDVMLILPSTDKSAQKVSSYFDTLWYNRDKKFFTTNYEEFKDTSLWKYLLYRVQEGSGLSTF